MNHIRCRKLGKKVLLVVIIFLFISGVTDIAVGQTVLPKSNEKIKKGQNKDSTEIPKPTAKPTAVLTVLKKTPIGTFNGKDYVQCDGKFEGATAKGAYRVPFRIFHPKNFDEGNGAIWVELPHSQAGLESMDLEFGREFLFSRGFSWAGVGLATRGKAIIDRSPGFEVIIAGKSADQNSDGLVDEAIRILDLSILKDFGTVLAQMSHDDIDKDKKSGGNAKNKKSFRNRHLYLIGLSGSAGALARTIQEGIPKGVFDGAFPWTGGSRTPPQVAIKKGVFDGKVITLSSERDSSKSLEDDGTTPDSYRHFVIAGTPHITDPFVFPSNSMTRSVESPATYNHQLRAHLLQLHRWVRYGEAPPLSTKLKRNKAGDIERDEKGNALTVNIKDVRVPRLPILELKEARYVIGGTGSVYKTSISSIGDSDFFATFDDYRKAFISAAEKYRKAGFMTKEDEAEMIRRAVMCPNNTYTQNYYSHYELFLKIESCKF